MKEDFPIFKAHPDLVYFDNAATTQKPRSVIDAVKEFYEKYNANIHRGIYSLARRATEIYEEAHEKVANFINATEGEVIFVKNATEGLNLAAHILANRVGPGENIVLSVSEHHSNFIPWFKIAEKRRAEVRVAPFGPKGVEEEKIVDIIDENTKIVALAHASNVTGQILDLKRIVKRARKVGAHVVVDGAQSVPHLPTDVKKMKISALAFSAHKMLGPTGIGALWMKKELLEEGEPLVFGGGMVRKVEYKGGIKVECGALPWKYEAGTPNIAGAAGFSAAVDYLKKYGVEKIIEHERRIVKEIMMFLKDCGAKIIGPEDMLKRGGLVSFYTEKASVHAIAQMLGLKNICVRSGFHCAEPLHRLLGIEGSVRVSAYIYNDEEDVERLINALGEIL